MWSLYRWVWQVESPLCIGMSPAGALNRCRLCIPARTIWAAITAEQARQKTAQFPAYADVGKWLRESACFTYLFPAEHVENAWRAWLPHFECQMGLAWRREDMPKCNPIADRRFRRRILDARPGTAIDPDSDSAEDTSLRETECVLPYWRQGSAKVNSPVGFAGYVFLKKGTQTLRDIADLFLGGDTRYGLGRLRRVEWAPASEVFGAQADLQQHSPVIRSCTLFAHARRGDDESEIFGAQEALAGWDLTAPDRLRLLSERPFWAPGSQIGGSGPIPDWQIDADGFWRHQEG